MAEQKQRDARTRVDELGGRGADVVNKAIHGLKDNAIARLEGDWAACEADLKAVIRKRSADPDEPTVVASRVVRASIDDEEGL